MTFDPSSPPCEGTDLDLWFPPSGGAHAGLVREALRICGTCPERAACLDAALEEEAAAGNCYRHGIRGGMTADQRSAIA